MPSELIIAIHVLVYLRKEKRQISSEELAKNVCVNPVRVRKVLGRLKKQGIVETKKGLSGGYYFQIEKETITLKEVYDALQIKICHTSWRSGNQDMDCMVSSGMSYVIDDLCDDLDLACQNYLATITIRDIIKKIEENYQKRD